MGDETRSGTGLSEPAAAAGVFARGATTVPLSGSIDVATSTALLPGSRINQYEIIRPLGKGGMGTVFLARDLRLGRRVAIKFLHTDQPAQTQLLLAEARTTARCQHENIIVIHEVSEYDGAPYIVLEYLDGKTLTALTEDGQRVPPTRAIEIMCAILRALSCAHEADIIHRDLKPDNIIVTRSGAIKVLDFGIAKVRKPQSPPGLHLGPADFLDGREPDDAIVGTLQYMAPEQWGIGIEIDHLTDIWACGILLHQMICGCHPLLPNQLIATAALDRPMPSMAETAPPGISRELIQIADRCLRKAKEQRWQSAAELLAALEPFLPGRRTPELQFDDSPYAGLSSFQETDAGKFFGRNREIAEVVARIRDRPLIAVVGSSGVGKSSFVRAGLVPALKRSGEQWESFIIRPGRRPLEALASVIHPKAAAAADLACQLEEQKQLANTLRAEPGYLGHVLRLRARRDNRRVLLFVDRFEELYTQVADPADRAAFTACLSAVADDTTSPLRVVLALRSDFLDRVAEDPQLGGELVQGLCFLGPPSRDGLRDAIANPAEMAGFQFEGPAIIDDMLVHLETTPGALPLLQFAATRLWDMRDRARRLFTYASYAAMGGIAGALSSHADRVVNSIGARKAPLIRAILLRLVTAERLCAIVPLEELCELSRKPGEVQRLVDRMVNARLLVVQTLEGGKGTTVEIVHESLVNGWPTLRRWLDENQDDVAFVDQLRTAARQWAAKGRDPGLLWRGDSADEMRKFRARYEGPLSDLERAFLEEVVRHGRAARRRMRALVTGGFTLLSLLVAGAMALAVVLQRASVREEQHSAEIGKANAENQRWLALATERERALLWADVEKRILSGRLSKSDQELLIKAKELMEITERLGAALDLSRSNEEEAKAAKHAAAAAANDAERTKAKRAVAAAANDAERTKAEAVVAKAEAEAEKLRSAVERSCDRDRTLLERSDPPAPPPSVAVPAQRRLVRPVDMESRAVTRIGGKTPVIGESRYDEVPPVISAKICIDTAGRVTAVDVLTKLEAEMERALANTLEGWTYAPYRLNGAAVPVCFAVSLHVSTAEPRTHS